MKSQLVSSFDLYYLIVVNNSGLIYYKLILLNFIPFYFIHKILKFLNQKETGIIHVSCFKLILIYFAYSIALVSLIMFTLICPGYSISFSILLAISLLRTIISLSLIFSGFTTILTSLPA